MLHRDRMSRRRLISALPLLFLLGSLDSTKSQAEPVPLTVATRISTLGLILDRYFSRRLFRKL